MIRKESLLFPGHRTEPEKCDKWKSVIGILLFLSLCSSIALLKGKLKHIYLFFFFFLGIYLNKNKSGSAKLGVGRSVLLRGAGERLLEWKGRCNVRKLLIGYSLNPSWQFVIGGP